MEHHAKRDATHCDCRSDLGHSMERSHSACCVKCDNMAVVATIRSGSCKERNTMHMRRCLAFLEAVGMFVLVAEHIKGVDNVVADALSRNNLSLATVLQDAAAVPERVPQALVELMTVPMLGWSEQQWDALRSFTFARD